MPAAPGASSVADNGSVLLILNDVGGMSWVAKLVGPHGRTVCHSARYRLGTTSVRLC